ncbi:MAG: tetratricopeptide repeat protein [Flavisolibacter sp.]
MNRNQWIIFGIALLIAAALYAASEKQFFGPPKIKKPQVEIANSTQYSTDSVLYYARKRLSADEITRLNFLEHSISRGDVKNQQVHINHQLAQFWGDTAKLFAPFAFYTAEAARLENSEKSLTFAARLFLDSLTEQNDPQLKQWEAFQAKDLFERSLKLNPNNDSSKVGLGEVYLYGGIAMPMKGISLIREVETKDPNNIYAQMSLGRASLMSNQVDKAVEHFKKVVSLQPNNIEAIFRVAEIDEQMGNKKDAIEWYTRLLPLIDKSEIRKDIETRIAELKK